MASDWNRLDLDCRCAHFVGPPQCQQQPDMCRSCDAGYALIGRLPALAGILAALAFSIKLYSGLLLIYLLVNGPKRATAAAAATVFILWLGLPVGLFGTDGAWRLYSGWSEQLRTISDPSLHASLAIGAGGPPIVSLQKAIVNLTGAKFGSVTTRAWLLAIETIWLAALLVYAWPCRGTFRVPIPSRAALPDWVVLMLAPLPFSPWLEPYHAVPVLVAVLLCVAVALDDHQLQSDRMIMLAAVAALSFFIVVKVPFAFRGFGLVGSFSYSCSRLLTCAPDLRSKRTSGHRSVAQAKRAGQGARQAQFAP